MLPEPPIPSSTPDRITNAEISLRKRKRSSHPILCFEGEIQQVLSNLIDVAHHQRQH